METLAEKRARFLRIMQSVSTLMEMAVLVLPKEQRDQRVRLLKIQGRVASEITATPEADDETA